MALTPLERERHRNYMKMRYQTDPEHRRKHKARVRARKALLRGEIHREPCRMCGEAQAEMHHEDYSKPLEVTWLCKSCHENHHVGDRP